MCQCFPALLRGGPPSPLLSIYIRRSLGWGRASPTICSIWAGRVRESAKQDTIHTRNKTMRKKTLVNPLPPPPPPPPEEGSLAKCFRREIEWERIDVSPERRGERGRGKGGSSHPRAFVCCSKEKRRRARKAL